MAEGDAGVYIVANLKDNEFFITGHAEYDPYSLKANMIEYKSWYGYAHSYQLLS